MHTVIRTNGHERAVIRWHDLTPSERKELDYRDTEESQESFEGFRYRGSVYDLSEVHMRAPSDMGRWDGLYNWTYDSGVCFRYPREGRKVVTDAVIVGCYWSVSD